jgi:hypothetical protein
MYALRSLEPERAQPSCLSSGACACCHVAMVLPRGDGAATWRCVDDGEWRAGRTAGYGVFRYPHGESYEGEWAADEKHGCGVYRYVDGRADAGRYDGGALVGEGVRWNSASGVHPQITCDKSGMSPIVGVRHKKRDADYDLCQAEFDKLAHDDRARFEAMMPVVAWRLADGAVVEGIDLEEARRIVERGGLPAGGAR